MKNKNIFYAKIAGLSYITFTTCGIVKNFLLNTKLSDIDDAQTSGVFVNEIQYRLGIGVESLMFLATLMASVAFYFVLRTVNRQLAQLVLCLRLCEVILGSFAVVTSIAILALSTKTHYIEIFNTEQLRTIVSIISSFRMPAYEYSWIFMGFAGVITFYLFFKSRYINRFWCIWGIFTYASLIIYPFAKMLIPNLPREVMFLIYPGALFELGVGIWLVVFGIKLPSNWNDLPNKLSQQDVADGAA